MEHHHHSKGDHRVARCRHLEEDNSKEVGSSRVAKEVEVEAEDEDSLGTRSGAISAGDWDTQLRIVPCAYRVNNRNTIEEAQEASHGGHPEQAGVVLAIEDEDRHGQPQ